MRYDFAYCRYVRNAGGVVILDEVVSGLGRVGDHYWAFQSHGKHDFH